MEAERKFDGHEGPIACLCVTDTSVYTGSSDHTMRRYSLASGECVDVYRGHRGWVITVNEFEGMVITSSKDETIRCWEAEVRRSVQAVLSLLNTLFGLMS